MLQSVIFNKKKFTSTSARAFLKRKKLKPIKRVDVTKNFLRYRIRPPWIFKSFITRKVGNVQYIIGLGKRK